MRYSDNTIVEQTELAPSDSPKCNKKTITFSSKHLQLLGTNNKHPLYSKLKLVEFLLSNSTSEHKTYLTQQRKLFWPYGEQKLKTDTTQDTRNGRNSSLRETLITFNQL